MNLRELKSVTYGLLDDASQQAVNFGTIVGYLNVAQTVLGNLLWNVDREKFLGIDQQATTNGTADYPTPSDLRELVRVVVGATATFKGYEATRMPVRDLNALGASTLYRPTYPNAIFYNEFEGNVPGKTRVRIDPTPITGAGVVAATGLSIWYYRRPVDFHVNGTQDGVATGGSTATILDTGLKYNTTLTGYTDFWKYAQIRITSGANEGRIVRLTSQTLASSTLTIDATLPTAIAAADTYEIDQMSILPEHVHYLMPYYAAGLAASKVGKNGSEFMALWNSEIEAMRRRLLDNVEVNIPGEIPMGASRARL